MRDMALSTRANFLAEDLYSKMLDIRVVDTVDNLLVTWFFIKPMYCNHNNRTSFKMR